MFPHGPRWAHVPGRTRGADDEWLSQIRPQERLEAGIALCGSGFFWEAHEVLEPLWQGLPPNSAARDMVRALIQIANAHLKVEMQRPAAAERLLREVATLLSGLRNCGPAACCGFELETLARRVNEALTRLRQEGRFSVEIAEARLTPPRS